MVGQSLEDIGDSRVPWVVGSGCRESCSPIRKDSCWCGLGGGSTGVRACATEGTANRDYTGPNYAHRVLWGRTGTRTVPGATNLGLCHLCSLCCWGLRGGC